MLALMAISLVFIVLGTGILLIDSNNVLWFIAYVIAIANFGFSAIVWAIKEEFYQ